MSSLKESAEIQHIRTILHKLVLAKSKTVERFAHEHGIEQSVLSKFFAGKSIISLTNLLRLAHALDVEIGSLFKSKSVALVSSGNQHIYTSKATRRNKVTVVIDETRTIEIKQKSTDSKPLLSFRLG